MVIVHFSVSLWY